MFSQPTVIVLGAGASWHYGYPTGELLVVDVIRHTERFQRYCEIRRKTQFNKGEMPAFMLEQRNGRNDIDSIVRVWDDQIAQCQDLANRLRHVAPVVIDYFLGWNEHLHDLGKMMIASALLEREANGASLSNLNRYYLHRASGNAGSFNYDNYKDNWVRYLVHKLLLDCKKSKDLLSNQIHFVSFNYERSLEANLERALRAAKFVETEDVEEFLSDGRCTHMYGVLNPVSGLRAAAFTALATDVKDLSNPVDHIAACNNLLQTVREASQALRVIDPHTKTQDAEMSLAQQLIRGARKIYFLGFGFDKNNLERLGFPIETGPRQSYRFAYTNLNDSLSVNKRAAQYLKLPDLRSSNSPFVASMNFAGERSIRDVYQALEYDFAAFDD